MTSHIKLYIVKNNESHLYSFIECVEALPLKIYRDAVNIIKELKLQNTLSHEIFYDRLISFHDYVARPTYNTTDTEYIVNLIYDYDCCAIICTAYKSDDFLGGYVFDNRYIFDDITEGNCIDDFIHRGINPQIDNINDLISSIKGRLSERKSAVEYHETSCYEHDFNEITLIKQCAQKIVDNCNKHLEQITEFYTKLN